MVCFICTLLTDVIVSHTHTHTHTHTPHFLGHCPPCSEHLDLELKGDMQCRCYLDGHRHCLLGGCPHSPTGEGASVPRALPSGVT